MHFDAPIETFTHYLCIMFLQKPQRVGLSQPGLGKSHVTAKGYFQGNRGVSKQHN